MWVNRCAREVRRREEDMCPIHDSMSDIMSVYIREARYGKSLDGMDGARGNDSSRPEASSGVDEIHNQLIGYRNTPE